MRMRGVADVVIKSIKRCALGASADTCPPRLPVENAGDGWDERETSFSSPTCMLLLHAMQASVG
jgi:hypothetical protein